MATALPDSSIQLVSDSQVQNDAAQSCKCGYCPMAALASLMLLYCVR